MKNNKNNLESYKIGKGIENRVFNGIIGLSLGTACGQCLITKTLNVASKMYNYMQTNTDFDFYNSLEQFYNTRDLLDTVGYTAGIIIGGAVLTASLFTPKYKIYKKDE